MSALPKDLPIAQLRTLELTKLLDRDSTEAESLFEACRVDGFFYLDLKNIDSHVNEVIDGMYQLDKELYDLPAEKKMLYDVDKISDMKLNGYKPVGRNFGGLAGQKDGFETYVMPADGIKGLHGQADFLRPSVADKHMSTLKEFVRLINAASTTIMSSLSTSLRLPEVSSLTTCHRPDHSSPDIIRLLKYHAQDISERGALHTPHTDLGSLTFLFTRQPGLQILAPNSEEWHWVEPRENCAVVNLGDMMALLTNGYLRSCLHRVGPLPGCAMPVRYSFAYLMRAEDWVPMTGLGGDVLPVNDGEGEVLTSGEWIRKKFGMLRLDSRSEKKGQEWVLTGNHVALPV